jgi:hypothetical protein
MKRKSMLAALALLVTSGAANAGYMDAVTTTTWADFAGSQNRCPRFQVIKEAIAAERAEAGVTESYDNHDLIRQYNEDPSEFCNKAWRRLGPNGTYKRQMLEGK